MNSVDTQKAHITALQASARLGTGVFKYTMSATIHAERFYQKFLQHLLQDDESNFDIRCAVLLEAVAMEVTIINVFKQKYDEQHVVKDVLEHAYKLQRLTTEPSHFA